MTRKLMPFMTAMVVALAMSVSALAKQSEQSHDQQSQQKKEQWLFVQTAESAELKALPDKQGYYSLTLKGINPQIVAFTDRPERKTHLMSPDDYTKLWDKGKNSFKEDAPNAAIEFQQFNAKGAGIQTTVFELVKQPEYDTKANTMRYTVKPLHQKSAETGTYQDVGVFVDSAVQIGGPRL